MQLTEYGINFSEKIMVGKVQVSVPLTSSLKKRLNVDSSSEMTGTIDMEMSLSESIINSIIVTAFEGGIGYWAVIDNDSSLPEWKDKQREIAVSEWSTKILLENKSVFLYDVEDESERWELTLEKVIKGYGQNFKERPHDASIEYGDATTADCIIQYALFDQIVFG